MLVGILYITDKEECCVQCQLGPSSTLAVIWREATSTKIEWGLLPVTEVDIQGEDVAMT